MIVLATIAGTLLVCLGFAGFYQAGRKAGALHAAKTLVLMLNSAAIGADSKGPTDPFEILKKATSGQDVN